jgi:hypothetical protein
MRLVVLSGLTLAGLTAQVSAYSSVSKMRILVVDSFGGGVDEAQVTVSGPGVSRTFVAHGETEIGLPFGKYSFECSAPASYETVTRQIVIDTKSKFVLLALPVKSPEQINGEGPILPWVISGSLSPAPKESPALVRILGIFTELAEEAEVDAQGHFQIQIFPAGKYLVLVLSGGQIVHQETLNLDFTLPRALHLQLRVKRRTGPPNVK